MSDWKEQALLLAKDGKLSWRKMAKQLGVPKSTLSDFLRKSGTQVCGVQEIVVNNSFVKDGLSICVIADTQCKPDIDLSYMQHIGKYIAEKRPDVIVNIGDQWDMPSLSSYDRGTKGFEGRRVKADLEAGHEGMRLLVDCWKDVEGYNPRMIFCIGNHDERLDRLVKYQPELEGIFGVKELNLEQYGWEVVDYLKPIEVEGIFFCHYLANPMSGKPYAGSAMNILKTVGRSFVVGHRQVLDVAIRPTVDGKQQIGIVNGAAYSHFEDYKGHAGNNHFRGLTMLHEVSDGFGLPMFISMSYLEKRFGGAS